MLRLVLALSALTFAAAPAAGGSYSASLESPTTQRIIASDIVWNCGAAACQGATDQSRPVVLCQSLAKRAGTVSSFLVDGRAFTPAELDKCNASAKAQPNKSFAAH